MTDKEKIEKIKKLRDALLEKEGDAVLIESKLTREIDEEVQKNKNELLKTMPKDAVDMLADFCVPKPKK